MTSSRREFLKSSATVAAVGFAANLASPRMVGAAASASRFAEDALRIAPTVGDPAIRALVLAAIDEAKRAGASYADARISQNRSRTLATRERRVQNLSDNETLGCGIRVLVDGTWGFAATRELTSDAIARTARLAVAQARANRRTQVAPVQLAPVTPTPNGTWSSPIRVDPFSVAIEDQVALLLRANEAALGVAGVKFVNSAMFFLREEKTFASTDGTVTVQTIYRSQPSMTVTAVSSDNSDFQSRQSTDIQPHGLGYEHVLDGKLVENAPRWGAEAVEKLKAKPVDVGRYDLVLHPSHLWLTIHESVGHPTELDRAYGYEANYAGTSFVSPPEKMLGTLRYGPEMLNVQGDRSQPGACATVGFDDEGVVPEDFLIIKDGMVNDYQTTREQANWLKWWYEKNGKPVRSHGCSYGDNWSSVQFQRMPNVSVLPGPKEQSFEDLIAATDKGIAIVGDGSFSIDQQRYNAQFGGQLFYEIKGGKVVGMLKDVAYQMRTPEFWNALDMLGGKKSYELGASFFDGKGQPGQSNSVSHGCPPTRHRQINVINTGRKA